MLFSLNSFLSGFVLPDCAAILICSALIIVMIRAGVMDHPGHRSSHTRPTPKGGGIGIIGAFLICLPLCHIATGQSAFNIPTLCLMCGVAFLALISWLDDIYSFPARYKLAAQFIASMLIFMSTSVPWAYIIPILLLSVFITNALNFIDGINGLAAGTMMLAAFLLAAVNVHSIPLDLLALCFAAFLPWNFPKAQIFMGDVGSQAGALIMAWAAMSKDYEVTLFVIALLAGILWDVSFTLVRRALAGDKLAHAHRGHLYQLAVRSGLPMPLVTLIYWLFTIWGAIMFLTLPLSTAFITIMIPQFLWTGYIFTRAKARVKERW
ncbi:glycosyltransferase family 4 protein [Swingsia samuiensis]|uniref:UDP-phosphate alpha N-acetylglucosaminyltransferase n=1 Tax=Swingsia samuiensis TaxID=1293412 RepID=A0A4Y6UJ26_9PROT|nr:UDP-phosphate alpha N-acetylglucosaminyltransferase [Swingsia samuiensis]QDH17603.1 UDP-phosphate alpha N-acetylglucosaminyltransferase [Swingsia samuiensis]